MSGATHATQASAEPAQRSGAGRRMKVLVLLTSSAGGAGQQAYQLCRDIDRERFDVTAAFGPGYPLDEDFAKLGFPLELVGFVRPLSPLTNLRGMFQVWRLMRREKYDVLLTSCSIAGFFGRIAASLAGLRWRVHIVQVYASRPFQPSVRQLMFRYIERAIDRLTTRYIAVSEAVKRYGVETELMPAEKVDVIYNAAELEPVAPGAPAQIRQEFSIPEGSRVVGTLGRFEEQKGLTYLLKAAARVLETYPDVHFLVVGEGPLEGELRAQAERLGISGVVHFTGWRRDVPEMLATMDVFCLASLWETFGIVLAEAMLAEVPIVASGVDGIPEVVADQETGFLVPPTNVEALTAALCSLLEDPARAREMGQAGRRRALEKFSVRTMVKQYEDFLEGLVGHEAGGVERGRKVETR